MTEVGFGEKLLLN